MVDELYLQYLGVLPTPSDDVEEPEEDKKPTYFSSYVSVYVKPDPPPARPPASKPSNTGGISLPPPPVRPPASKPSNTGGWSLPPPRRDPRPDDSRTERPNDGSDSDSARPGRIVEELQDQRPDYSDDLGQAVEDAYKDVNGI